MSSNPRQSNSPGRPGRASASLPTTGGEGDDSIPIRQSARNVGLRFGRRDALDLTPRRMLRLTRSQRMLLREGLADLRAYFQDADLWRAAADEAFRAEQELGIPHLGAGFCMWASSMAALTHGAWWLLMPGCGAPVLQDTICGSLDRPFLERRAEYDRLRRAIEEEARFPLIAQVLERTERIRCMLAVHVRQPE